MRKDRSDSTVTTTSVTSARLSHTDDIALRQKRYVITQSLRILCVVLATVLPVSLLWKGVFVVGAVALPWFGVVMANAGPTMGRVRRSALVDSPVDEPLRIAIEPGRVIDAER